MVRQLLLLLERIRRLGSIAHIDCGKLTKLTKLTLTNDMAPKAKVGAEGQPKSQPFASVGIGVGLRLAMKLRVLAGFCLPLLLLLILLPMGCRSALSTDSLGKGQLQLCRNKLNSLTPPDDRSDYHSWENTRKFSQAERQAIQSLSLVSENLSAETKSGYRNYQIPSNKLMQEQLQDGNFQTILPIQNIDGWNLFVLAELFAPASYFIRSFVLLIEGANGWQSRYLFPSKANQGNYRGGYDIAMYSSDLAHDGQKELIFTSHTGGTGAQISSEVLQIKQVPNQLRLEFVSLEIPSLHSYQAEFQDNFQVRVQLREDNRPILIRRVPLAHQQNLDFDKNGRWIGGNVQPWLYQEPTRLQPIKWNCNGVIYRLLYTEQPLRGLVNADSIGYFQSFWVLQASREESMRGPSSKDVVRSAEALPKTSNQGYLGLSAGSTPAKPFWSLLKNQFSPTLGNEVLDYEALLP